MEISLHLPTKITKQFGFSKDRYIRIEFVYKDYFYVLSDAYHEGKLFMDKYSFDGELVESTSFYVDPGIKINNLDKFIITEFGLVGVFVDYTGSYLSLISLDDRTGIELDYLVNEKIKGCGILEYKNYIVVFGGIRYDDYGCNDGAAELLFAHDLKLGKTLVKDFYHLQRMKALVYHDDKFVYIKYGIDANNYLVEHTEKFPLSDIFNNDVTICTIQAVTKSTKLKEKCLLEFSEDTYESLDSLREYFDSISDISYARDSESTYVLMRKHGLTYLSIENKDELVKISAHDGYARLLCKHQSEVVMMINDEIVFLKKTEPTLLNFMRSKIFSSCMTSGSCERVQELINDENQKCMIQFYQKRVAAP